MGKIEYFIRSYIIKLYNVFAVQVIKISIQNLDMIIKIRGKLMSLLYLQKFVIL